MTEQQLSHEYDRIHSALPGWAHDTSDVPLSACVKAAFTALELQVERLTLERDEARRMTEERSHAFVQYPILLARIAAIEPYVRNEKLRADFCRFCGNIRHAPHLKDCIWQHAVNAAEGIRIAAKLAETRS